MKKKVKPKLNRNDIAWSAMLEIIRKNPSAFVNDNTIFNQTAKGAVKYADALLKELNEKL